VFKENVYVNGEWEVKEDEAAFHGFSSEHEVDERGNYGNYTVAILELKDGTLKTIPVCNVRFIPDRPKLDPAVLQTLRELGLDAP